MSCYTLQGIEGRSGVPGPEGEEGDKVRTTVKVCHVTPEVINLLAFRDSLVQKESRGLLVGKDQSVQR